jgi:hypothetical protein
VLVPDKHFSAATIKFPMAMIATNEDSCLFGNLPPERFSHCVKLLLPIASCLQQ